MQEELAMYTKITIAEGLIIFERSEHKGDLSGRLRTDLRIAFFVKVYFPLC
jgi:hypothetical protein